MSHHVLILDPDHYSSSQDARTALQNAGISILSPSSNQGYYFKVEATEEQIQDIAGVISYQEFQSPINYKAQDLNIDHLVFTVDPTGDSEYVPAYTGKDSKVFLVDTGIGVSHPEFLDAQIVQFYSRFTDSENAPFYDDTAGHGTAIASLIVGKNLGVSKEAELYNVKLFETAVGQAVVGEIVDGLNSIMDFVMESGETRPVVVCLPWTTEKNQFLNSFVEYMNQQGVIVVCAAGNDSVPIDTVSPASVLDAITVGAFDRNFVVSGFNNTAWGGSDSTEGYTNYGAALDIFALGVDVQVANFQEDPNYMLASGTSAAAGIVAGVAAHYVERYPTSTASSIKNLMIADGMQFGSNFLVFDDQETVSYADVNKSMATTHKHSGTQLTSLGNGILGIFELGQTTSVPLLIHSQASNLEILDFASAPPWITVDFENNIATVDTSNPDENFPGPGVFIFAIRADIDGNTYVEEIKVVVVESALDVPDFESSYYYDPNTNEYDAVVNVASAFFLK